MKTTKLFVPILACAAVLLTGCKKDDGGESGEFYTVTLTDDGNGTAYTDTDLDPETGELIAEEGTTVTLTADPNEGYKFKQWMVIGGGVTLSSTTTNPATFRMPAEAVSVKAEFEVRPAITLNVSGVGNVGDGDEIHLKTRDYLGAAEGQSYTIGTSSIYWDELLNNTPPFDFIAFYPYISGVEVQQDGFNVATEANPDLLSASALSVAAGDDVNLSSTFYNATQLAEAVVTLKNLKSNAIINLDDGTADYAISGDDAYPPQTGSATRFIVTPQNTTEGTELIRIEIAGQTYQLYTIGIPTVLESGKTMTVDLSIYEDVLGASTGISPWE